MTGWDLAPPQSLVGHLHTPTLSPGHGEVVSSSTKGRGSRLSLKVPEGADTHGPLTWAGGDAVSWCWRAARTRRDQTGVGGATAPVTSFHWVRMAVRADGVMHRVRDVPGERKRTGFSPFRVDVLGTGPEVRLLFGAPRLGGSRNPLLFPPRTFHRMSVPRNTFWEMLATLTLEERGG